MDNFFVSAFRMKPSEQIQVSSFKLIDFLPKNIRPINFVDDLLVCI